MKKYLKYLLLVLIMAIVPLIGFSDWVLVDNTVITPSEPIGQSVCYTTDGGNMHFQSIEDALDESHKRPGTHYIIVIPGSHARITRNCSIGANTTLVVPYELDYDANGAPINPRMSNFEGNHKEKTYKQKNRNSNGSFTTKTVSCDDKSDTLGPINVNKDQVLAFRQTTITIAANVKLTIDYKAHLILDSEYGQRGPNGKYCEIILEQNAKIENHGLFDCYGFIRNKTYATPPAQNDARLINFGGVLRTVFGLYDINCSGGELQLLNKRKISIINTFDFPCLRTTTEVKANSNFLGVMHMFRSFGVGDQLMENQIPIYDSTVGNNSLFKSNKVDGSTIFELIYTDTQKATADELDFGKFSRLGDKGVMISDGTIFTKLNVINDLRLDHFLMEIPNKDLAGGDYITQNMFMPISYLLHINVKNGAKLSLPYKIKLLPGTKFLIDEGGTVELTSKMIVYSASEYNTSGRRKNYPSIEQDAEFINNGIFYINYYGDNNNTQFGGKIKTTNTNGTAIVQLSDNTNNEVAYGKIGKGERALYCRSDEGFYNDRITLQAEGVTFTGGKRKICHFSPGQVTRSQVSPNMDPNSNETYWTDSLVRPCGQITINFVSTDETLVKFNVAVYLYHDPVNGENASYNEIMYYDLGDATYFPGPGKQENKQIILACDSYVKINIVSSYGCQATKPDGTVLNDYFLYYNVPVVNVSSVPSYKFYATRDNSGSLSGRGNIQTEVYENFKEGYKVANGADCGDNPTSLGYNLVLKFGESFNGFKLKRNSYFMYRTSMPNYKYGSESLYIFTPGIDNAYIGMSPLVNRAFKVTGNIEIRRIGGSSRI